MTNIVQVKAPVASACYKKGQSLLASSKCSVVILTFLNRNPAVQEVQSSKRALKCTFTLRSLEGALSSIHLPDVKEII